jgi:hypothetical protein
MAIADVPGEPGKSCADVAVISTAARALPVTRTMAAVVEHEAVAVTQRGRMRQIEQECRAALAGQRHRGDGGRGISTTRSIAFAVFQCRPS